MTNEPSGNNIIAMNVGNDGTLVCSISDSLEGLSDSEYIQSAAQAIATLGQGAHGITSPVGPDALFSQGSVKASQAGKALAVVNVSTTLVVDPR